jgi:choline dehydrogenase-like flavoprotein
MIVDLAAQEGGQSRDADVVIVGAGIAGLLLANRLREANLRTIVLESGEREQRSENHELNRVVDLADPYLGAVRGRARCLGGTSTRWGGALIPLLPSDLAARPYLNLPAWPIRMEEIEPYLPQVEALFGLDSGSYDERFVIDTGAGAYVPIGDEDFNARFAKWPTFKLRNLATLFGRQLEHDRGLEIWINATAAGFDRDPDNGRIRAVTARHQSGKSMVVTAREVVICAGAIETTRLLLLLDRQSGGASDRESVLGKHFFDHISTILARIRADDVNKLNRMAGFRFVGRTMRSFRLELSPSAQRRERVASAFGHISFKAARRTGFDALRDLMRSRQKTGGFDVALLLAVLKDTPYLAQAGIWRFLRNQLYWPAPAEYELQVAAEQLPREQNRITLSSGVDRLGMPLAALAWRVVQSDLAVFDAFQRCFGSYWTRQNLSRIGEIEWVWKPGREPTADLFRGSDIYHPGGSTRMADNARGGVVDRDLRSFTSANLWVSSTSVFPSGGSANPTLTLMLLTLRLADRLKQQLRHVAPKSGLGSLRGDGSEHLSDTVATPHDRLRA